MAGSRLEVNLHLLPVKASYYFALAAVASLVPFLAVYMKKLGLSPSETAIIYGTMPFLGALARPVLGAVADKFHKHKEILMVACVLTGTFYACLLAVPGVPTTSPFAMTAQLSCDGESHIKYCDDVKHHNKKCQLTSSDLLNRTMAWNLYDPLLDASDCSLKCNLHQEENLCLEMKSRPQVCETTFRPSEETNFSSIEISIKSLDHSHCVQSESDNLVPKICNFYGLTNFTYNGSDFYNLLCQKPILIDCHLKCDKLMNADDNDKCVEVPVHPIRYSTTFWGFFMLMFLANIAFAPVFSLIDAITYDFLGEERGKWGKQRLWGTIGFAVHGLATGLIMDLLSGSGREFLLAFVSFAVFEVVTAIIVCQYRISSNVTCSSMMKNMRILLSRLDIFALFVIIFIFGMFTGVIETFLYWYLSGLGATKTLFGICMFVNCLPEIFIFFLSGTIMKHISQVRCLYIVCFAYALRFMGYSLISNPWVVLAIEPLHSITFGLMYAAASSYGSKITPAGMHGTVQGLIGGLHFGFGKGCGSVLGGQLYEAVGAIVMFRSCAVASLITFILYFSVQQYLGCKERKESSSKKEEMKDIGSVEEKGEMLPNAMDGDGEKTIKAVLLDDEQKGRHGDATC